MKEKQYRRSLRQAEILMQLDEKPAKTITELAERMGAQRPSISRSLRLLKEQGMVFRDRKGWHLTEAGKDEASSAKVTLIETREKLKNIRGRTDEIFGRMGVLTDTTRAIDALAEFGSVKMVSDALAELGSAKTVSDALAELGSAKMVSDALAEFGSVKSLAYSPVGNMVASGSYGYVTLWNTGERKTLTDIFRNRRLNTFQLDNNSINNVTFSPNGQFLASGAGKSIFIWDIMGGELLKTLSGHTAKINRLEYLPSGKVLASGSSDGTVILWDV